MNGNLIIITFDQLRGDWVDTQKEKVAIPNLKSLAENSLVLSRCYCAAPQCMPSRFSWLSNLYPSEFGMTKNSETDMPSNAPSFIRKLRDNGWSTSLVGKTHWTNHRKPCDLRLKKSSIEKLGFEEIIEVAGPRALRHVECDLTDEWNKAEIREAYIKDLKERYNGEKEKTAWTPRPSILPLHLYPDYWIAQKGIEILKSRPKNKNWVHWISFVGPHEPFDTPVEFSKERGLRLDNLRVSINSNWIDKLDDRNNLKQQYKRWKGKVSWGDIYKLRVDYSNRISMLDTLIGDILVEARKREDFRRTAVVVTSDHGEMLGDYGILYKSNLLEQSINVPFIYIPPIEQEEVYGRELIIEKKPIGLSKALNKIAKALLNGRLNKNDISRKLRKQKYVICEYDSEFAIIYKNIKVVFSNSGEVVWMSEINKNQKDTKIRVGSEIKEYSHKNKRLLKVLEFGRKESLKRADDDWVKFSSAESSVMARPN